MDDRPFYLTPEITGTIHVDIQTADGVVMVADSRSSAGSIASNPYSNKIWQVAPRVFFGRCGRTAHTQMLTRLARYTLGVLAVNSETPCARCVKVAAEFTANVIQNNKKDLSGIIMVGGWDAAGPQLFEISQSGFILQRRIAVTGSGSAYVTGLIDATYRGDFTLDEATAFAVRMVAYAMVRDGSCGGVINIVQITEKSVVRRTVRSEQLPVDESSVRT